MATHPQTESPEPATDPTPSSPPSTSSSTAAPNPRAPLFTPPSSSPPPPPSSPDDPASESASPPLVDEGPASATPAASPASNTSRAELRRLIRQGLEAITGAANQWLADEDGKARQLYLATDRELDDSSAAAANLGARHGLAITGDVADLAVLGAVAGAYLIRQIQTRAELRKARRAATLQQELAPEAAA